MKMETLKRQILTAKGDVRAELVLKNARVINVLTNEIEQADVAIFRASSLAWGTTPARPSWTCRASMSARGLWMGTSTLKAPCSAAGL